MQYMRKSVAAGIFLLWAGTGWTAEVMVQVVGNRVNLRSRPEPNAEVIGQAEEGARLTARSISGDWVEIAAPDSVAAWVHRDFIENGTVRVSRLNVRGGPGITYQEIGFLNQGDPVQIREEFGEWLKIAPPDNASLWVSREFVQVLQPPKRRVEPSQEPSPTQPLPPPDPLPPLMTPAPSATPYVPEDLILMEIEGQGRAVQREGMVRVADRWFNRRPTRFQLEGELDGKRTLICYLRGSDDQLHSFKNRHLRIKGREYQIKGSRLPVVVVDAIAILDPPL